MFQSTTMSFSKTSAFFLLGLFTAKFGFAAEAPAAPGPGAIPYIAPEEKRGHAADSVTNGDSFAPILGYDPTYGLLLGAAYFHGDTESPVTTGNIVFTGTLHANYGLIGKYKIWTREHWYVATEVGTTHFFDSYFGEGDTSSPSDQIKIQNYKTYGVPALGFRFDEYNSIILSAELRYRRETGVNGAVGQKIFGNEFTPAFGLAYVYDDRDNQDDTHSGTLLQSKIFVGPKSMSNREGAQDFVKLLLEIREFVQLFSVVTLGVHLQAGTSIGEPGYQYRFDLGGSTDMRGYQSNRLRGRHFYEGQGEVRLRLMPWLSVVGFTDMGDTADIKLSEFHRTKVTKGGGLRIGLPPDYVAKARLDFGIAPDEKNIYLSFNEAF